jgi:histidine ammonia-lyase
MTDTIVLDGNSLTRAQLGRRGSQGQQGFAGSGSSSRAARGGFSGREGQLRRADLRRHHRLRQQCRQAAGRASSARRIAGRQSAQAEGTLLEELQHNLIITHAVCVGKPFGEDVVRAMLLIRINTLMRGIRVSA